MCDGSSSRLVAPYNTRTVVGLSWISSYHSNRGLSLSFFLSFCLSCSLSVSLALFLSLLLSFCLSCSMCLCTHFVYMYDVSYFPFPFRSQGCMIRSIIVRWLVGLWCKSSWPSRGSGLCNSSHASRKPKWPTTHLGCLHILSLIYFLVFSRLIFISFLSPPFLLQKYQQMYTFDICYLSTYFSFALFFSPSLFFKRNFIKLFDSFITSFLSWVIL